VPGRQKPQGRFAPVDRSKAMVRGNAFIENAGAGLRTAGVGIFELLKLGWRDSISALTANCFARFKKEPGVSLVRLEAQKVPRMRAISRRSRENAATAGLAGE
jgi:hypothetical protein